MAYTTHYFRVSLVTSFSLGLLGQTSPHVWYVKSIGKVMVLRWQYLLLKWFQMFSMKLCHYYYLNECTLIVQIINSFFVYPSLLNCAITCPNSQYTVIAGRDLGGDAAANPPLPQQCYGWFMNITTGDGNLLLFSFWEKRNASSVSHIRPRKL